MRIIKLVDDAKLNFGMVALTDDGPLKQDFKLQNDCLLYNFPLTKEKEPKLEIQCLKMQKEYVLLSSEKHPQFRDLINYECNMMISKTNKELFHENSKSGTIPVLSVTSGTKTSHFCIKKDIESGSKEVIDIRVMRRRQASVPIRLLTFDNRNDKEEEENPE